MGQEVMTVMAPCKATNKKPGNVIVSIFLLKFWNNLWKRGQMRLGPFIWYMRGRLDKWDFCFWWTSIIGQILRILWPDFAQSCFWGETATIHLKMCRFDSKSSQFCGWIKLWGKTTLGALMQCKLLYTSPSPNINNRLNHLFYASKLRIYLYFNFERLLFFVKCTFWDLSTVTSSLFFVIF